MTVNPFFQKNSILDSIQKTLYWKQTPLSIFLCVQDKKIEYDITLFLFSS